jgi:Protein of unknown function (DUF3558)
MRFRLVASVIAAGSMIALAGCTPNSEAPPSAVQASPTQAASPIPPVNNPRDVAALAHQPCQLLTAQQVAGFGLDPAPKQYNAGLGDVGCKWTSTTRDRQTYRTVRIDTFTNNLTLEAAYAREHNQPFFELTEIAGYPAIIARSNPDLPHCDIDVKPAEHQSFSLSYDSDTLNKSPEQACVVGKQVAAAVLTNLPAKG